MVIQILLLSFVFLVAFFYLNSTKPTKKLQFFWLSNKFNAFALTSPKKTPCNCTNINGEDELKRIFDMFDKNKDGFITKEELYGSLKNIGMSMDDAEIEEMVEKLDSNGDGLIDFNEFCQVFESKDEAEDEERKKREVGEEEDELKRAFDVFDGNKDGLITVDELRYVLSSMGMMMMGGKRIMMDDCKEMIDRVDEDGDGMVNFDEFKRMMMMMKN